MDVYIEKNEGLVFIRSVAQDTILCMGMADEKKLILDVAREDGYRVVGFVGFSDDETRFLKIVHAFTPTKGGYP